MSRDSTYFSEIDGLRAIAVCSVIIFHANSALIPGGYLGVDIFFVISGFPITKILVSEIQAGTFTFWDFYQRRARRILPALTLVCLSCVLPAWYLLPPDQLKDFFQSLVSVALFSANALFLIESDYFGVEAELKPLLHTWSLAVEEQFYLIFPAFLILVRRWFAGITPLIWAVFLMGAASLIFSHYSAPRYPDFNFFMIFSRAWELAVGALVFLILRRSEEIGWRVSSRQADLIFVTGMLWMLPPFFLFDANTLFPSAWGLPPILGTGLVIYAIMNNSALSGFLSVAPMRWVGVISYSAYLWHQPLFAFARAYFVSEPPGWVFALLTVATFVLAMLSWRYIEQPFRKRGMRQVFSDVRAIRLAFASIVLLVGIGSLGHFGNGFPGRIERRETAELKTLTDSMSPHALSDQRCEQSPDQIRPSGLCQVFDQPDEALRIGVFGDSHASAILPAFEIMSKDLSADVFFKRTGCPPLFGIYRFPMINGDDCNDQVAGLAAVAASEELDIVLLISRWSLYTDENAANSGQFVSLAPFSANALNYASSRAAFERAVLLTAEDYRRRGIPIVFMAQVPQQKIHAKDTVVKMVLRSASYEDRIAMIRSTSQIKDKPLPGPYHSEVLLAANGACSHAVNLGDVFLEDGRYAWSDGYVSFYRDKDHLSTAGARRVAPRLGSVLKELVAGDLFAECRR